MPRLSYPFTEKQSEEAHEAWGANCGPNALAFALQVNLDAVRDAIPGFEEKRYMSPTMMRQALLNLDARFVSAIADRANLFRPEIALVRVQWCGPWTAPGAKPKWAYRQTHWIAAWKEDYTGLDLVFDCNGGINRFEDWEATIVPLLTKSTPRADGKWFPTHIWRLLGLKETPCP